MRVYHGQRGLSTVFETFCFGNLNNIDRKNPAQNGTLILAVHFLFPAQLGGIHQHDAAVLVAAIQNWLDTFKETAATGDIYDPDNAAVMKAMVEYIVVHRDRMEIHLKCGVTIDKEFV